MTERKTPRTTAATDLLTGKPSEYSTGDVSVYDWNNPTETFPTKKALRAMKHITLTDENKRSFLWVDLSGQAGTAKWLAGQLAGHAKGAMLLWVDAPKDVAFPAAGDKITATAVNSQQRVIIVLACCPSRPGVSKVGYVIAQVGVIPPRV